MVNPVYEPKGKAREYCERALNLYTGCGHGCTYCYAPSVMRMTRSQFIHVHVREGVLEALEKQCKTGTLDGLTVLLCFTCDPYCIEAYESGVTRKAMSILLQNNVNFTVLTKGGTLACSDFDMYRKEDSFGTTLTFANIDASRTWEPYAALPQDRIKAIKQAKERGVNTWVSLEPVLSPFDAKLFVHNLHEYVDLWKVGKWNYDARADDIDWYRFGNDIEELFIKYGCNYYIKDDLWNEMGRTCR